MFENYTFEFLMERALARIVDRDIDKRQGSIIYDALAPACAELCQAYIEIDRVIDETFADTASREYLIKRAKERGIAPYEATYAIVLAELKGSFELKGGERFNLEDVNYSYIGEMEGDYYKLKSETAGEAGNKLYGDLIPIDNISGLESAKVVELFYVGEEAEATEKFRARYFESFESQAFGGNIADYKEKMQKLNEDSEITNNGGVGGVKVYPVWNGGGTVKVVFTSKSHNAPSESLVSLVQEAVMPLDKASEGLGFAPIGHNVTVEGASEVEINVTTTLTLKADFVIEDILGYVENAVEGYLGELREQWALEEGLIVRTSNIDSRILDIEGVLDIEGTAINGSESNLNLGENEIPVKGVVEC